MQCHPQQIGVGTAARPGRLHFRVTLPPGDASMVQGRTQPAATHKRRRRHSCGNVARGSRCGEAAAGIEPDSRRRRSAREYIKKTKAETTIWATVECQLAPVDVGSHTAGSAESWRKAGGIVDAA